MPSRGLRLWPGQVAAHGADPEAVEQQDAQDRLRCVGNQTKLVMNEKAGLLRLDTTHYWLGPRPGGRLILYTPADSDSRDRLEKLTASL